LTCFPFCLPAKEKKKGGISYLALTSPGLIVGKRKKRGWKRGNSAGKTAFSPSKRKRGGGKGRAVITSSYYEKY